MNAPSSFDIDRHAFIAKEAENSEKSPSAPDPDASWREKTEGRPGGQDNAAADDLERAVEDLVRHVDGIVGGSANRTGGKAGKKHPSAKSRSFEADLASGSSGVSLHRADLQVILQRLDEIVLLSKTAVPPEGAWRKLEECHARIGQLEDGSAGQIALADRLTEVIETLSSSAISERLQRLDDGLLQIVDSLEGSGSKDPPSLDVVKSSLTHVQSRLDALHAAMPEAGFAGFDAAIKSLADRLENQSDHYDGKRLSTLENHLSALVKAVDRLAKDQRSLEQLTLEQLSSGNVKIEAHVPPEFDRLGDLLERVESRLQFQPTEEDHADISRPIEQLSNAIRVFSDSSAVTGLAEVREDLAALRSEQSVAGPRSDRLISVLEGIGKQLDRLPRERPATAEDMRDQIAQFLVALSQQSESATEPDAEEGALPEARPDLTARAMEKVMQRLAALGRNAAGANVIDEVHDGDAAAIFAKSVPESDGQADQTDAPDQISGKADLPEELRDEIRASTVPRGSFGQRNALANEAVPAGAAFEGGLDAVAEATAAAVAAAAEVNAMGAAVEAARSTADRTATDGDAVAEDVSDGGGVHEDAAEGDVAKWHAADGADGIAAEGYAVAEYSVEEGTAEGHAVNDAAAEKDRPSHDALSSQDDETSGQDGIGGRRGKEVGAQERSKGARERSDGARERSKGARDGSWVLDKLSATGFLDRSARSAGSPGPAGPAGSAGSAGSVGSAGSPGSTGPNGRQEPTLDDPPRDGLHDPVSGDAKKHAAPAEASDMTGFDLGLSGALGKGFAREGEAESEVPVDLLTMARRAARATAMKADRDTASVKAGTPSGARRWPGGVTGSLRLTSILAAAALVSAILIPRPTIPFADPVVQRHMNSIDTLIDGFGELRSELPAIIAQNGPLTTGSVRSGIKGEILNGIDSVHEQPDILIAVPDLKTTFAAPHLLEVGSFSGLVAQWGGSIDSGVDEAGTLVDVADNDTSEQEIRSFAQTSGKPSMLVGFGPNESEMREVAEAGDPEALFKLANLIVQGQVLAIENNEEIKLYQKAAKGGSADAQYALATSYEAGRGVERDPKMAAFWYRQAAEAKHAKAMHNLAVLYAGGVDGQPDLRAAAHWFEQAAMLGVHDSQFNLAILYAKGAGVAINLDEAYKWFAVAARSGDRQAIDRRNALAKSMGADQIALLDRSVTLLVERLKSENFGSLAHTAGNSDEDA